MSIYGPLRKMVEIDMAHARLEEAKRALANIPHHINCNSLTSTGCFQGDETQGYCLQICQRNRILFLHKKLTRLERIGTAKRRQG